MELYVEAVVTCSCSFRARQCTEVSYYRKGAGSVSDIATFRKEAYEAFKDLDWQPLGGGDWLCPLHATHKE